ncbi:Maturation and nuclear export of 40S ribosomal subunits interacting protein [Sporothrix stenoceras]|uniref:Maturation and nuclear export of 40S ribosomal subunits interacting protein n=1 Tax=Sporothrix stenoceras TaxID=5173 RepID=A0ABR3ZNS4_9PEZI
MPAATTTKAAAAKRKRSTKTDAPRKRTRSESGSDDEMADGDETSVQERILLLESQIGESKKHYNNIVELIEIAKKGAGEDDEEDDEDQDEEDEQNPSLMAAVALCRVFMRLLAAGSLNLNRSMSEKEVVVVKWLKDQLTEYEAVLLNILGGSSGDAASTALTLAMRLLQAEGQSRRKKAGSSNDEETYVFPQAFLALIVRGLVLASAKLDSETAEGLSDEFVEKYVSEFCDVQFYTFKAVSTVLADISLDSPESSTAAHGAFYLLSLLDDVPATSDEFETFFVNPPPQKRSHALYSVAKHRKQAQDAWLAVLQRTTSVSSSTDGKTLRKRALGIASTVIAPWFAQPEMMLDFLTDCYDAGGSTSLLALSGLYYLIKERNVDYPAFFPKLYSLLDAELMHSKHRARFFRLLDTFLASTHLPVQMVASFIKRFARLCLHAPPSAVVSVVPWIYNMLKTHPQCTFMIHRVPRTPEERALLSEEGMADPFLQHERDPMETHAVDSCLWEIVQLQSHYHPNVATIAKILSEQFTKQSYNVEDFFDHSYQSMLEAEFGKEVRKTPVVEFQIPKRIFLPHKPVEGAEDQPEDALLVKLWDFA